jgi:hypothetical protein
MNVAATTSTETPHNTSYLTRPEGRIGYDICGNGSLGARARPRAAGVLAYLVAWAIVPEEGGRSSIAEDLIGKSRPTRRDGRIHRAPRSRLEDTR